MSLYRTFLVGVVTLALTTPLFADDAAAPQTVSTETTTTSTTITEQAQVNLNTASAKELMKVKGINAAKAHAIVAYRKKNGDFKSTDELMNVKGFNKMKPAMLRTIQIQVVVS